MENIIIIGAGGFGREVAWLIERTSKYNILGYVDDNSEVESKDYNYLGNMSYLKSIKEKTAIAIAIGNPFVREKIYLSIAEKENFSFPNLIDPNALVGNRVTMGIGNIICANSVLTVDIALENFNLINLNTTIGHDVQLASFNSVYPSVNLSGYVSLNGHVEIGTGCQLIPGVTINENATLGAGSVAIKDIPANAVAVGIPASIKKIKE
ncbi:NeuD/PglB/VioB family sugar acetyltransferase [Enterococcus sp. LJL128]